jgi:hypothetical protein
MKMDIVANSKNDEFYTPEYAIFPLLQFLYKKNFKIIWCPFDTEESLFVKIFREKGFEVIATHIKDNQNFFEYNIENIPTCDIIISNPPYSLKGKVLERLFKIKKPFAMLVGVVGLFESKHRFEMFKENDFEILYFDKRIAFFKDFGEQKPSLNPPFSSVYVCYKLLPKQICFEYVDKNAKHGDWRDLPDKDYKQCEVCGKFFTDVERHKNTVHGFKTQQTLTKLQEGGNSSQP